tara:strand:+ start:13115 stop:13732 length:618 start_codon:yes stop_codon:yes gene_type:complete
MEYYIYDVPVFVTHDPPDPKIVPEFCSLAEETLPPSLLHNIDVVYVGEFKELQDKNAAFLNGGIYMTCYEPSSYDMLENFVHEAAHSLEPRYAWQIYDQSLVQEFKGKRERLRSILEQEGFKINPQLYDLTEYSQKFDEFLAHEVGYPTLLTLTMGLFVSPYGATSLQEYFANGFEKYFLDSPYAIKDVSPVLYRKIEEIINEQA